MGRKRRLSWGFAGRAVASAAATVLVSSCALSHGAKLPSTSSSPLVDDSVCGVVSTDALESGLGFATTFYQYRAYFHSGAGEVEPDGNFYECYMQSNSQSLALMEIRYHPGDSVNVAGIQRAKLTAALGLDDIPSVYPESAEAVDIQGLEGEGWAWRDGASAFIAWRYPDHCVVIARLVSTDPDGPVPEQAQHYRALIEQLIPKIPDMAARAPMSVSAPSVSSAH